VKPDGQGYHLLACEGRTVLVLVDRVELAVDLAGDLAEEGIRAAELVSSVAKTIRAKRLAAFRRGELKVLVATQLADEALDVPAIDCVILGSPSSSAGTVQQRIGRALRPRPGKATPEVWDLCDEGHQAAALVRQRLYAELGWPTTIVRLKR
jgi:superfamily II DNA or RNA helicase